MWETFNKNFWHPCAECWACLPIVSTDYQWNKCACTAGGPKNFLKQGPTGKSPGFPAGQSATVEKKQKETINQWKTDVDKLQWVQKRAVKLFPELSKKPHRELLKILNLPTLKYRWYRGDIIELYKIIKGIYVDFMELSADLISTRGNNFKLIQHHCHYDWRKFNFTNWVIPIWCSLSNHIVSADTVVTFKDRFDNFWSNLA